MKNTIMAFLLIITPLPALAAITGISGTVSDGESVVISGSGFGSKTQAAPIQWDNFEAGTSGNVISTPVVGSNWVNGSSVRYTNTVTRPNSSLSSRHDFTTGTNYNQALTRSGGPWRELYISFYYRTDYGNLTCYYDDPCRNHKIVRFEGDNGDKTGDQGEGVPLVSYEKRASSSSAGLFETALRADYNVTAGSGTFYGGNHERPPLDWSHQEWHRVELYMNINTGSKEFLMWEDAEHNNPSKLVNGWTVTYEPLMGSDDSSFNELHFGIYFARDNGASAYVYMDDIYVDTTMARVELGNASTWSACTHREVQVPTAWASGEITATVNTGSFNAADTVYLYVVDADGTVNESGYELEIDGEPTITCYLDADADGYSPGTYEVVSSCSANYYIASSLTATSGDCNDSSASIHPGATDTACNEIDEDCSGTDYCVVAVNGVCGLSDGVLSSTEPITNLCTTGLASDISTSGIFWIWTCAGVDGGTDDSCSAQSRIGLCSPSGAVNFH